MQAIDKGNLEGAKIYAENTIRKKNESLQMLQLSSRIDGVASKLQSISAQRGVARSMAGISQQLGMAMRKNGARVMDLFREWDTDGDGEVSRKEFHKAMPMLGFEATKKDINELFDSWDKDGGGSLDFRELQKILKAPPPKEKVQKATGKLKAVAALTKAGAGRGARPKK